MKKFLLVMVFVLGLSLTLGSIAFAKKDNDNGPGGDQMQSNSVENFIEDMEAIPEEEQEEVYNQKLEQMYKLEANTLKSNGNEDVKARKLEVIREKIEILKVLLGCDDVTHAEGRMCVSNFRDCEVENGIGQETWDDGRGVCTVVSCDADYHTEDDLTCIEDIREADCGGTIPSSASASSSASYTQTWNGTVWMPELDWEFGADPCGFECDLNYTWTGSSCEADTREMDCGGAIADNANATTNPFFVQTWNGNAWTPSVIIWTEGASLCGFECDSNFIWDGATCIANTQEMACGGEIPANASANTSPTYTQVWSGGLWTPQLDWEYNVLECGYLCDTNYRWNGTACEGRTIRAGCSGSVPTNAERITESYFLQTWNGYSWAPDEIFWTHNASECGFACKTNYTWEGDDCIADTRRVECGGMVPDNASAVTSSNYIQTWNGSVWRPELNWRYKASECGFECHLNYRWNGTECFPVTQEVACGGEIPANASATTATGYNQTWNGIEWEPDGLEWENEASICGFACDTDYTWNGTECEADLVDITFDTDLYSLSDANLKLLFQSEDYTALWPTGACNPANITIDTTTFDAAGGTQSVAAMNLNANTIYKVSSGTYNLAGYLDGLGHIKSNADCVAIIGEDKDTTIFKTSVNAASTLGASINIDPEADYNILYGFTVDGSNSSGGRYAYGVYLEATSYNVANNIVIHDLPNNGFYLLDSDYNIGKNIELYNNQIGLYVSRSSYNQMDKISTNKNYHGVYVGLGGNNILSRIDSYNNNSMGIYITNTMYNSINNVLSYNNIHGIRIESGGYNTISNTQSFNNHYQGFYVYYSLYNVFDTIDSYNNNDNGMYFIYSHFNRLNNISSYNNNLFGIYNAGSNGLYYYGNFRVFANVLTYSGAFPQGNDDFMGFEDGVINTTSELMTCNYMANPVATDSTLFQAGDCSLRGRMSPYLTLKTGSYVFGSSLPNQTQPMRYDGWYTYYGTDGQEYDSSKYIGEF